MPHGECVDKIVSGKCGQPLGKEQDDDVQPAVILAAV